MSEKWMLETLEKLGFKHLDAEIYAYLAKNDQQKAKAIAEACKTPKKQLYRFLKRLQLKGMIIASPDRPARFSAVSFEKVLDLFAATYREKAKRIEDNKEQILLLWKTEIRSDP